MAVSFRTVFATDHTNQELPVGDAFFLRLEKYKLCQTRELPEAIKEANLGCSEEFALFCDGLHVVFSGNLQIFLQILAPVVF
jgi:hypothetical protein